MLEPGQGHQQPDFLLVQLGGPFQFPDAVVHRPVALLRHQAEYHAPQVGAHAGGIGLVGFKLRLRLRQNRLIAIATGLAQHGGTQQRVQMALAGLRRPPGTLRRRPEQPPPESAVRFQARLLGNQPLNLPEVGSQVAPHRGVRFAAVGFGQRQEAGHRQQAGPGQGVGVVLDAQSVGGRQNAAGNGGHQAFPVGVGVIDPVEPRLVGVDLEPVGLRRGGHRHRVAGGVDQRGGSHAGYAGYGHGQRHRPDLFRISIVITAVAGLAQDGVIHEAFLPDGEGQPGTVPGPGGIVNGGHLQRRVAHLPRPAAHNGGDRLPGGFLQGPPQVNRAGVAVGMAVQVDIQPRAEGVGRQEMLQHPQHRPALAVADGVKKLAHLGGVGDFLLNGMRILETVQAEGAVGVHIDELRPHRPFREQPVHGLGAYPGGETFVEPQVIPPFHSHQVAEPHMRHFVGHHLGHPLPGACRRVLRVHQQRRFPVGYAAPVLHRPGREVRYGQVIQLGQRVGDAEVVVEKGQQLDRRVQGELPLLLFAPGHPHAHPRAVGRLLLNVRQVADDEGQQVGGHHRRGVKDHLFETRRRAFAFRHDGRVGHRLHGLGNVEGNPEGGLDRRFVPAGQGAAGVGGLKLGGSQIRRFALRVGVLAAVKAPQLVVQLPGVRHFQMLVAHQPLGRRARDADDGALAIGVVGNARGRLFVLAANVAPARRRRFDVNLGAVEHDLPDAGFHLHGDVHLAGEGKVIKIGGQRQFVVNGANIVGQDNGVGGRHRIFLRGTGQWIRAMARPLAIAMSNGRMAAGKRQTAMAAASAGAPKCSTPDALSAPKPAGPAPPVARIRLTAFR